jgi:hypothetical protein
MMAAMRRRALLSAFVIALLAAAPAVAQDPDARALYAEGRFVEAAETAAGEPASADAQALSAKAYAAAAILAATLGEAQSLADAARAHAEAAVALDPRHVEGRLQLAVALGLQSRRQGGLEAYLDGMPQRGLALIEAAKADAPDEAWAYALLGAWHFESLRRGGRWARRMLDADLAEGEAAFARAQELDPGDAAIAAQAGLSYLSLDPERFGARATSALDRALSVPPRDAFEAALQERAREARALIDAEDHAALESAVARWFGG